MDQVCTARRAPWLINQGHPWLIHDRGIPTPCLRPRANPTPRIDLTHRSPVGKCCRVDDIRGESLQLHDNL